MNAVRRTSIFFTVSSLLVSAAGCPDRDDGVTEDSMNRDGYVCTVHEDSTAQTVEAHGAVLTVGETSTRSLAVTVDPRTSLRLHTATLIYELESGASARLGIRVGKWVKPLGSSAEAAVEGTAGVGFTYDRVKAGDAEDVLGEKWPPDRWNRLIITLGAKASGKAAALSKDLEKRISADSTVKGYLTLFPDGRFSLLRTFNARFDGRVPAWVLKRLGVEGAGPGGKWKGRFALAYEILFDRNGSPTRLTTVADTESGKRLDRATRIVNLRKKRSFREVDRALGMVLIDPFTAFTADQVFLGRRHSRLWAELDRAETTVGTRYEVESTLKDYPLDLGPFGVGYHSEKISRKLTESLVRTRGGREAISCTGRPSVPKPPKKTEKYRSIPAEEVPPPPSEPPVGESSFPGPAVSELSSPESGESASGEPPSEPASPPSDATAPLPDPGEV